jgi:hypothetical protein
MQLTCTRKKNVFKNLTVNKTYEAVEEGENFLVTNDAGLKAKYAKAYFRINPQTPVTRPIASVTAVEVTDDEETINITVNRTMRSVGMDIDGVNMSCGIDSVSGIAALKSTVRDLIRNKVDTIIGTEAELFLIVMNAYLEELRNNSPRMCYLFSDAIRPVDAAMDEVLDEIAETKSIGHNPNSGNEIALWVIK